MAVGPLRAEDLAEEGVERFLDALARSAVDVELAPEAGQDPFEDEKGAPLRIRPQRGRREQREAAEMSGALP